MLTQEIFGDQSIDPVPLGIRVGDLIHGLRISGRDPKSGDLPEGIEAQLENAYANLRTCVENAGAALENVAQVSMFFADFPADRGAMNPPWVNTFPDDADRPTYKFMPARLPAGERVHFEFFAVAGQRRRLLAVEGVAHTNPIPLGVRIGPYLFSSRVLPYDPSTGQSPADAEAQAEFLFQNTDALLKEGGMSWREVRQARAFVAEPGHQAYVEGRWQARLPEAGTRPVLHSVRYGGGPLQVMLEVIAIEG